jgi:hypothetical protein
MTTKSKNSLICTLATAFFFATCLQTRAADREYLDYLDMCVDFVFPYAVAITLRLNGKSNDEATDHIVQLQKARFSDFDDMDLGATWRIVDDTYALDLVAWAEKYGEDTNRQKTMWTIKAFSDCLRDTNYLEPK